MTAAEFLNGVKSEINTISFFREVCQAEGLQVEELCELDPTFDKKAFGEWLASDILPKPGVTPITAVTAAELADMNIPDVQWLVDDFLPVGSSCLSAPPKFYKSYMALDLCLSICTGTPFLGHRTHKASCLYFDLESSKRRPKQRIKQVLGDRKPPDNLYIITGDCEPGKLGSGFEDCLLDQLRQHPDIRLFVIDVLQKIRPPKKPGTTAYDSDYDLFAPLNKIAIQNNVGILCITHNRKMKDPGDPFADINGSAGVLGSVDAAFVISKQRRYDEEAVLYVTGREVREMELAVKFNQSTYIWESLGDVETVRKQREDQEYLDSPVVEAIRKLVSIHSGSWSGTVSDIYEYCRLTNISIHDDMRKTGQRLQEWISRGNFELFDKISARYMRSNGERKYHFDVTDGTHGTDGTTCH